MHTYTLTTRYRGQVILVALVFFAIFTILSTSVVSTVTTFSSVERSTITTSKAGYIAEAGVNKAAYELNQNPTYAGESYTAFGGGEFSTTLTTIDSNTKHLQVIAYYPSHTSPMVTKTIDVNLALSNDVISFHYGIQAGAGGFTLSNSSSITGNVFSGGSVIGNNNNLISGDVVSAGAGGLIKGIHATGNAYAHTIGQAGAGNAVTIDGDAYYVSKTNTTVSGTLHPGSPDLSTVPLPISDAKIAEWEATAVAGGTISNCDAQGNYEITSSRSLGSIKIACNLVVKSTSAVLTVIGPIWVAGNITTQTGPTIKLDASLGSQNVAIIADNPSNTTGSGVITIGQSTIFQGSGAVGSFVFLISQNNSAETGGSNVAIDMGQGASALVAYAAHGLLTLSQSVSVKEATGYKIDLSQSANVTYDTGLPSTVFQTGAGGSWAIVPGTYSMH